MTRRREVKTQMQEPARFRVCYEIEGVERVAILVKAFTQRSASHQARSRVSSIAKIEGASIGQDLEFKVLSVEQVS